MQESIYRAVVASITSINVGYCLRIILYILWLRLFIKWSCIWMANRCQCITNYSNTTYTLLTQTLAIVFLLKARGIIANYFQSRLI